MVPRFPTPERWVLLLLCSLVVAVNISKPIHIDDGWHIRAAQWIAGHPLQPMSGEVHWSGSEQYFHEGNNPPLLFYGLAAVGSVTHWNEWALHLFVSLFGVGAILIFRRITVALECQRGVFLTAVLASSSVLLVVQNLMLDVPLLACELWFLLLLLRGHKERSPGLFIGAGLVLGAAVLIKYSLLPLVLLLGYSLWSTFRFKRLWIMIVPIAMWALWGVMNVAEFGSVHMFRNTGGQLPDPRELWERFVTDVMIMGSVLPAAAGIGIALIGRPRWHAHAIALLFTCIALLIGKTLAGLWPQVGSAAALVILFTCSGTLLVAGILVRLIRAPVWPRMGPVGQRHALIIIGSGALLLVLFNMVFAPFMAPRHMLLVLPLLLLLGHDAFAQLSRGWSAFLLSGSLVLSIWMAISDHRYAAFYKDAAATIAARFPHQQRWHNGAWGWGWYSDQHGSMDLSSTNARPNVGDIIATPIYCVPDYLPEGVSAHGIDTIKQELSMLDVIDTRHWAKFYCVKFLAAPWDFTTGQAEVIIIRQVDR